MGRLVRQRLLESLLLAVLGAAGGLWVAFLGTRGIWNYMMTEQPLTGGAPFGMNFNVDGQVFHFTTGIAVFAKLATGLVPPSRPARLRRLGAGGRGQRNLCPPMRRSPPPSSSFCPGLSSSNAIGVTERSRG